MIAFAASSTEALPGCDYAQTTPSPPATQGGNVTPIFDNALRTAPSRAASRFRHAEGEEMVRPSRRRRFAHQGPHIGVFHP